MIEVSKVHYDVIAITEKKVQLNITQAVEGLGWEEEEDELAMKITFELYNAKYNGSRLSSLIKIGCVVAIKAYWGSGKGIVAMGNVTECERSTTKADEVFNVVAYDNLYSMQRSQDNIYFAAGKGTKSALTEVFKNWGITLSSYSGPDVSHAKILYKAMERTIEANKKYYKKTTLQELDVEIDKLRKYVRLSYRLKYIDFKKYKQWSEQVNEIGRMLGGWMASTKK